MTGNGPRSPLSIGRRIMLDALGLGLGETMSRFAHQPDWPTFSAWILENAGPPDPVAIARYHAWLDGTPPPQEVTDLFAAIEAMPDALDAEEIAHWDAHGYVVLRGAATPDQAADAADLLYRVTGATPDDPESWYGRGVGTIMVEHFQGDVLRDIHRNPRIHKAFAQLLGTTDLWLQNDRMSLNPPLRPDRSAPGLGHRLHWDVSLAPPVPLGIQGIMYLTDTSPDQGALELVPGFHHRVDAWVAAQGEANPREVDLSDQAITIGAGAGDLVLWHQALPHGASPNRAHRPRLAHYLTMYTPDQVVHDEWR
jgi:hypothetical protein